MHPPSAASVRTVSLTPTAGFCVKSVALNDVSCSVSVSPESPPQPVTIPTGLKVFVNIAWDANIPPPPDGTDAAIENALASQSDIPPDDAAQWSLPLIVSDPRPDSDKAGKPSIVLDAIYHTALKPRALRSAPFKTYLIELAFQRIEAQHGLLLSRQIGTPNIASKGKLKPRPALVPTAPFSPTSSLGPSSDPSSSRKPLIEELPASSTPAATSSKPNAPIKGILKPTPSSQDALLPDSSESTHRGTTPELSWSAADDGRLRIVLSVPHLTRTAILSTTLDIEPRRLIFTTPPLPGTPAPSGYALDLDLARPDADIRTRFGGAALSLKAQRAFDVDGARAEWRVAEGVFVVYV